MNRYHKLSITGAIIGLAIVAVLFSGGLPPGDSSNSGEAPTTGDSTTNVLSTGVSDGGRARQIASVGIKVKRVYSNISERNGVKMRILVDTRVRGHGDIKYDNIQFCAYDANGTILNRTSIGDITTDPSGEYYNNYRTNITVQSLPQFMTIDHPRLRNDSRFGVELLDKREDRIFYDVTYKSLNQIQDRFEWPRTNETGKCG